MKYFNSNHKIIIIHLLISFWCCPTLFAQNNVSFNQTIRGTIVDEDTQAPIVGANVFIKDSSPILGTISNFDGDFKIGKVPVGRHTIVVSYLGYETKVLPNQLVGSGKELILNIGLVEAVTQMDAVIISSGGKTKATNEMAIVSTQSFSVEETKRFAAGISDPARLVTAYAAVSGNGGDDQNAIIIRGNSPRGLLWRLEGMEIPNPNHFASEGASSGGVSILSANTLSKSDFYTGAFPAQLGNALSGAFDLKLRNGNDEKREYTFQASLLGVEAAIEGPFKKNSNASYLVNYRYSTLSLFNDIGINIVSEENETTYQDASFKFMLPTKKTGTFSLYGIGGLSEDKFKPENSSYSETQTSNMGVIGLNHVYNLTPKSLLKSSVSLSGTSVGNKAIETASNYQFTEDKKRSFLRIGSGLRYKFSARHILESGLIYTHMGYNFVEREMDPDNNPPLDNFELLNEKGHAGSLQGYSSWKYRITDKLSLVTGLHALYFSLSKKLNIEPRFALKWQFSPEESIGVGFGIHSRIESLEFYLGRYTDDTGVISQPNRALDFTKAWHYVLSYDNVLNDNWYFKAETYFQQLYNVPIGTSTDDIFSTLLLEDDYVIRPLVNSGTGTNYGLELTLQRFFNKGFYLLATGSLYEAKYKARDNLERNTPFASNFATSLLSGKEFAIGKSKQNLLGFNFRGTWGGNRRFIPVDLTASQNANAEIFDLTRAYESRLPDFWKLDFQISYRINKPEITHEIRVDILNFTNRENIASRSYNVFTQNIESDRQTGIIPAIGYRIEF
ncbi:TonB-dependent receptor [Seonamhaeicola sp.]|uniref:TonB-dependent receptor n=1 Tax=Seonamhaeicola sp. TaxID=1912245 RepID=UPI00261792B1|nr:TonB-dependent receptor [Seonamhaeicola sp.]